MRVNELQTIVFIGGQNHVGGGGAITEKSLFLSIEVLY